jgi:dihydroorotase-like cyclic amidohydrolase
VPATATDIHGPIDFVLMEFPGDRLTGEAAAALMDLVDRGIIRVYDLLVISKGDDGSVGVLELTESGAVVAGFDAFSGARSGLLDNDDARDAAEAMRPNTVAALVVYENTWAVPFVAAARKSGGDVIASARIPAADVMAALEILESLEAPATATT